MSFHFDKKKYFHFIFLIIVFCLFLFVRLYHFSEVLDFSADQATFSLQALKMWQTKRPILIGPTFSIHVDGRYAFQGPAIYYLQLFFLLLGNWDPAFSSAFFVVFAGLMIFPLFQGTKWLVNQKAAYIMVFLYSFLPLYLQYSRFLWNPNYQLSLFPIVIWLIGKFSITHGRKWFFILAIMCGLLLQLHYQFFIVLFGLICYYFVVKKLSFKNFLLFMFGLAIGFSPLIFFELRHNFYNIQTVFLFVRTMFQAHTANSAGVSFQPHYILTISFAACLVALRLLRHKISKLAAECFCTALFFWALILTFHSSTHAFGMPANWNLLKEEKAEAIIQTQQLTQFQVINLIYDTDATVQNYLLAKDGVQLTADYTHEKYLFVLGTDAELEQTQAYELSSFTPRQLKQTWQIDANGHQLYLFQREQ